MALDACLSAACNDDATVETFACDPRKSIGGRTDRFPAWEARDRAASSILTILVGSGPFRSAGSKSLLAVAMELPTATTGGRLRVAPG